MPMSGLVARIYSYPLSRGRKALNPLITKIFFLGTAFAVIIH
jgi:hypothetical protein